MAGVGMAALGAWVPCRRWNKAAVFGFHRGLTALLARKPKGTPLWLPGLITPELEIQMATYKNAQWEDGEKMFFL